MKRLAKRLLIGTRWELPARRLHHALTRNPNSLYDAQTIEVMRRVLRADSNAVDIGAFEGGMLRHMTRLAPRGRHIAFEPLPGRAESLAGRFPRAQVLPYAVGDQPGEAEYVCVTAAPALSGLKARPDLPDPARVEVVRVRVETLDRVIPSDLPIALLKVDAEGGELGVFRGAAATLRRNRPVVVFECGLAASSYGAHPGTVFDELGSAGLRISTLGAWLARRAPLDRGGFVERVSDGSEFFFIAHP